MPRAAARAAMMEAGGGPAPPGGATPPGQAAAPSAAARNAAARIPVLGYDVVVASGALARIAAHLPQSLRPHRWAVVTDDTVAPLHAARVVGALGPGRTLLLTVPPGEAQKTRESWARLTDAMLASGLGRDCAVVALGGGVVGDLAGFVAATYMRGVPVVQAPTTLLAMIDASIGGKTGVDTPAGKNLVGAFHQPAAVVADPEALRTLPVAQLRAGLAEAIKHGVIADEGYFDWIAADPERLLADPAALERLVVRSVEIKAAVVRRDEREGGVRKVLNLGHTVGHAVESASGYRLLHGEAVAIGLVAESAIAERMGVAERGTRARVAAAVARAGLPARVPAGLDREALVAAMRGDKKARAGAIEMALPARVGAMAGEEHGWAIRVDEAAVREALA
jgi:3-dehydroquinate synthase